LPGALGEARVELETPAVGGKSQLPSNARSAKIAQTKRQAKRRTQRCRGLQAGDRIAGKIAWIAAWPP
jgi:hypothetical protein